MSTQPGEFDVGPASEMQKKFGWFAENRPIIRVNIEEVPQHLRDLIPYVERWAIPCDVTRGDYFSKQPDTDLKDLAGTVGSRTKEINAWLDSIGSGEAATHFMCLLKACLDAVCIFGVEL